jgi:hypothetical protein
METSMAERLERAAATLNDLIALAREAGLHETAQFLAMAKLNLLIELNGITEDEFRALCVALEDGTISRGRRGARPLSLRVRGVEEPDEALSCRQPWLAPDGLASLRAARVKQ